MNQEIHGLIGQSNAELLNENANKDAGVIPTQRDLLAGIIAKHYAKQYILPKDVVKAHEEGVLHYHDLDYAPFFPMFNCMLVDLDGMLKTGFKMGNAEIRTPRSILRNRIRGLGKRRKTPVFPKLVFAIKEGLNRRPGDPNYDMKQLALECASKRMYPDILNYDQTVEVTGSFKYPMGCRSFLGNFVNKNGPHENGRASISLGYIGLHETINALYGTGVHVFDDPELRGKAVRNVRTLREAVDQWKAETGYGFSLYSTPSENLCDRFCRIDLKQFGHVEGVTDKGYYTNSFHLDVEKKVDPYDELDFERVYPEWHLVKQIEILILNHNHTLNHNLSY